MQQRVYVQDTVMQEEEEDDVDVDEEGNVKTSNKTENKLWIDKYTSLKFFDLLTDEITNRNVLTCLKSWDEVV